MGHPKLKKKTFKKPTHPWQKERIDAEKELLKAFGLKNKAEIWRANSLLRKYTSQAKKLITLNTPQAEKEKKQLFTKLSSLGLVSVEAKLEDVLSLTTEDLLSRRLQTIVHKMKLAKTIRQARQFITHGHVNIGDKKLTVPSYLVGVNEEAMINFSPSSELSNQDHPERPVQIAETKEEAEVLKKKEKSKTSKKEGEKNSDKKEKSDSKKETKKKDDKKESKPKDKKSDDKTEKKSDDKEKPKEDKKE